LEKIGYKLKSLLWRVPEMMLKGSVLRISLLDAADINPSLYFVYKLFIEKEFHLYNLFMNYARDKVKQ
jgi:hypothetical protein